MLPPLLQEPETATSDERTRYIMAVRQAIREGAKPTVEHQRTVINCLRAERKDLMQPKRSSGKAHKVERAAMADEDL